MDKIFSIAISIGVSLLINFLSHRALQYSTVSGLLYRRFGNDHLHRYKIYGLLEGFPSRPGSVQKLRRALMNRVKIGIIGISPRFINIFM